MTRNDRRWWCLYVLIIIFLSSLYIYYKKRPFITNIFTFDPLLCLNLCKVRGRERKEGGNGCLTPTTQTIYWQGSQPCKQMERKNSVPETRCELKTASPHCMRESFNCQVRETLEGHGFLSARYHSLSNPPCLWNLLQVCVGPSESEYRSPASGSCHLSMACQPHVFRRVHTCFWCSIDPGTTPEVPYSALFTPAHPAPCFWQTLHSPVVMVITFTCITQRQQQQKSRAFLILVHALLALYSSSSVCSNFILGVCVEVGHYLLSPTPVSTSTSSQTSPNHLDLIIADNYKRYNLPSVRMLTSGRRSYEARASCCHGATWEYEGQVVMKQILSYPRAVVRKRWQRCPGVNKHEVMSAGSGHRCISLETWCWYLLRGHHLLWLHDYLPQVKVFIGGK